MGSIPRRWSLTTIHALPCRSSWWLLRYLGHNRVALLDGGFHGWLSNGYPLQTQFLSLLAQFVPKLQQEQVVDITAVKARLNLSGVVLVDSRESDRYRGEREIDKIAGHILARSTYLAGGF